MILPNKHLLSRDSLIGVGGLLLTKIGPGGTTVSKLWEGVRDRREVGTYDRFILALDTLYLLGYIALEDGMLAMRERGA
ncbi:MAG: ABC-three component system middle component 6 [Thermodesulfobacteriota bacterium]